MTKFFFPHFHIFGLLIKCRIRQNRYIIPILLMDDNNNNNNKTSSFYILKYILFKFTMGFYTYLKYIFSVYTRKNIVNKYLKKIFFFILVLYLSYFLQCRYSYLYKVHIYWLPTNDFKNVLSSF